MFKPYNYQKAGYLIYAKDEFSVKASKNTIEFSANGVIGQVDKKYSYTATIPEFNTYTWHHLVAKVGEFSNTMTLYIDGKQYINGEFKGIIPNHIEDSSHRREVGRGDYVDGKSQDLYSGAIDNLIISNHINKDSIYDTVSYNYEAHYYPVFNNINNNFLNTRVYGIFTGYSGQDFPQSIADHNGTITGFAHSFDGDDDAIAFRDSQLNLSRGEMTVSLWFKVDLTQFNAEKCEPLLSYAPSFEISLGGGCSLKNDSGGSDSVAVVFKTWTEDDDYKNLGTSANVWGSGWVHFVGVIKGQGKDKKMYYYLNEGIWADAHTRSVSFPSSIQKLDAPLKIGTNNQEYFKGRISTVKIYDYALTDAERLQLNKE